MRLIEYLDKKIGRYAVQNLTIYLIAGQSFFYIMYLTGRLDRTATYFSADLLMAGEWWRILALPFDPPRQSLIFTLVAWYFFYMIGTTLEAHWGAFRYNAYIFTGCLITVAVSFLFPGYPVSNVFLVGSVFLAFATLFPDYQILLFFVLPVRMKWLALLTWIGYGYQFLLGPWPTKLLIMAAISNFLIFFAQDIVINLRYGRRQFAKKAVRATAARKEPGPIHRCTTCGITDASHPDMDFRYCPQCEGTQGYCRDHIFSHEHVRKS
jgi:hypothetical protein